ncbi:signal peptidase I [Asanoa ferruginea]|uniref:Signal peptidase I n=1 Tax=Asanoa ferruginea TaxID=53367 RepID=A0A3D9ZYX4_9ACTN|nr:signal peptidase I [Asanoa ferruginea]REF99040.1 signal peptidase I [Asanoa ferruginea]GIF46276.1 S26 family signal peptidase [Asanoa ferruginea]
MTYLAAAALLLAAGVGVGVVRRRFQLIVVRGSSMSPTYQDRDVLLVRVHRRPRLGDVVVFRMPDQHKDDGPAWMVKRVAAGPGDRVPADERRIVAESTVADGCLLVRGDNPESHDSRHFGYVPIDTVLGVVVRPVTPWN